MRNKSILIVDDIHINRVLLSEIVKEMGSTSLEAKDGQEAIKILETKQVDIVLMDIEMPVMNGFETTIYIRENFSTPMNQIPIIAITAHDPNSFYEEYQGAGFNDLITKPYTYAKLSKTISTILGGIA